MKSRLWTLSSCIWILSVVILATIYSAWLIYSLEIDLFKLTLQVTFSKDELLKNYNILLNYLTNPFVSKLSMPDFPSSEKGLKHFSDVKHLFHLTQAIFLILLIPSWRFLKNGMKEKSLFLHQKTFAIAAITPFLVGLAGFFIGFDNFFTLFHEVLFPGDSTWLFNPATDPIIWVLPEEFFLHCFLIFFVLYELIMLGLLLIGRKQLHNQLENKFES